VNEVGDEELGAYPGRRGIVLKMRELRKAGFPRIG
jgi:hypothetical protein